MIKAWDAEPEVIDRWVKYLEKHSMGGVGIRVTKWERLPLGIGKTRLARLKDAFRVPAPEGMSSADVKLLEVHEEADSDANRKKAIQALGSKIITKEMQTLKGSMTTTSNALTRKSKKNASTTQQNGRGASATATTAPQQKGKGTPSPATPKPTTASAEGSKTPAPQPTSKPTPPAKKGDTSPAAPTKAASASPASSQKPAKGTTAGSQANVAAKQASGDNTQNGVKPKQQGQGSKGPGSTAGKSGGKV